MTKPGEPCPRHDGATCFHRHLCSDGCVELAYEREAPRVEAELRRRAALKDSKKESP